MTIFAGYDLETTGLEIGDHRIVEVYVGLWKEDGTQIFEFEQRIDPQRSIAADAMRVHGITAADLIGMPTFDKVAPKLAAILEKADEHVTANGATFDQPFLEHEYRRLGLIYPRRPLYDTARQATWATPDGKVPRLAELCFACDVPYDTAVAHSGKRDVQVMMEAFFKARSWGYFTEPYLLETGLPVAA